MKIVKLFSVLICLNMTACASLKAYLHDHEREERIAKEEAAEEIRWNSLTHEQQVQEEVLEAQIRQAKAQEAAARSAGFANLFNSLMQIRQNNMQNSFQPLPINGHVNQLQRR